MLVAEPERVINMDTDDIASAQVSGSSPGILVQWPVADQSRFFARSGNESRIRVSSVLLSTRFQTATSPILPSNNSPLVAPSPIWNPTVVGVEGAMPVTEPMEAPLTKNSTELSDFMDAAICDHSLRAIEPGIS